MSALRTLKRLREAGLEEIKGRGLQEVSKLGERLLGAGVGEMSDAALVAEIDPSLRGRTAVESAVSVFASMRTDLLRGAAWRDAAAAAMSPEAARALVERADRAVRGRFDVLGLRDVSYGDPIDWHRDAVSGRRAPLVHWSAIAETDPSAGGDKKVIWELNRHAHFVTLGQAYALTGDERYAEAFAAHLESWMDGNPPNLGVNWVSSLELAFRSIAWLWALALFSGSPALTPELLARALKHLIAHGRHIAAYPSTYFSPNTHLTGEALGLFYLGILLPGLRRAEGWRAFGREVLLEQLPIQVRPDGVYFEQSTWYQAYTADFYLHLLALSRAAGEDLPAGALERIASAVDFLAWVTRPDGEVSRIGDDDGGRLLALGARRPGDFRDTLAAGAVLFGRGDWKAAVGGDAPELVWLLGPDALDAYRALEPAPTPRLSRSFPDGGYFVMRDGWSERAGYAAIDCGPHGALSCGHAHADALSFEFAAGGRTWVVDPGTFVYTADPAARDAFRASSAHNTIVVNGRSQSEPGGPFSWRTSARAEAHELVDAGGAVLFRGSHDGYSRLRNPVTHTRTLLFVRGNEALGLPAYCVVVDALRAVGLHGYTLRYHLPPGAGAKASRTAVEAQAGGGLLRIEAHGKFVLRARVEGGWVSPCYGAKLQAPVASIDASGVGEDQIVSFVLPGAEGRHVFRVEPQSTGSGQSFVIESPEARDILIVEGLRPAVTGRVPRETVLWARFVGGRITSVLRIEGDGPAGAPTDEHRPRRAHAIELAARASRAGRK